MTQSALETVGVFDEAIRDVESRLEEGDVFPDVVIRRKHFRLLLRDIQHLQGHVADMSMGLRKHLGDSEQLLAKSQGSHQKELEYSLSLERRLKDWAVITEFGDHRPVLQSTLKTETVLQLLLMRTLRFCQ